MTNEQKNQVAAMNASGMSVDEIVLDTGLEKQEVADFVTERNGKRGRPISEQTRQAIVEWYQSGHPVSQTAKKFGVDPKTVKKAVGLLPKEKEPAAAATATDSREITVQVKDSTVSAESQALRGVEVIGLMQTMLIGIEENFGDNVEVMSLRADSDTANIVFRYGGTAYSVQFGLAF
jgi:transposase-like protein